MEIYLDNAATTKPFAEIKNVVCSLIDSNYANPSSIHEMGFSAYNIIKDTQKNIALALNVNYDDIYFTSGGTESNNMAILGVAEGYKRIGKHIIITAIEHPSVIEPVKMLSEKGFDIDFIPVDGEGAIDINYLREKIRKDTILVSSMHVNNETGSINNIAQIGFVIKEINPMTLFHVDAIQSFGKIKILPKQSKIDLLSISAHKIHGLKGCGALYINGTLKKMRPLIYGGGQQKKLRSGTENVIGIAAMNYAIGAVSSKLNENFEYIKMLKLRLINGITNNIDNCLVNGADYNESSPYILNVSFMGVKGEVLMRALGEYNIYVSTGASCNSKKNTKSYVLKAMGLDGSRIEGAMRFSFSILNDKKQIDECISALKIIVPKLRFSKEKGEY